MTDLPFSFSHLSIAGGVRAAAGRDPGKLAYRHGERTRTYAQLIERIDRVTTALRGDLGLREGDHGAIVAKNSIEYMELVIGAAQAGVALATVNPKLAPAEIKAVCEDAGARVLFVDADSEAALSDTGIDGLDRTIVIENDYDDWIARSRPDAPPVVEEWGTFTIPYTSGTTGKPKGVLISHRSRILSMFAMASEYGCYAPDDRFLAIAPMCHGAGMIFSLTPVFFGGYAEIMDAFDPEQVMLRLKQERMTGFFGVPTHFNVLFSLEKAFLDANRPGHVKTVISNAAALPQAMKETLVDYLGPGILHETYGSTEAGIVLNLRPADQLRKQACVGQPIPATLVSIRDDDGNECGAEEVGELFSRSPFLFNGYWNRPEETAEAYRDGWVTVGDMVRRDAEGYCYIVDRKKDLVISGGVNIYPREIEEVLIMHPQVKDVAVIGVPDDKWGESLKAFVVGDTADSESLEAFCAERISRMKTPRAFEFIDTIPRNATGKVLKTELRKRG
jgi:acyl-CoA synthetase (AMP-forming)/AMP-acid ligase II